MNYYPYGMVMPGRSYSSPSFRYGYNGKEKDDEVKGGGNNLDYGARIYDPRLGRWFTPDPVAYGFSHFSPYSYAGNRPTLFVDYDGKYFGIDDAVCALVGGTVNLGVAMYMGDVKNVGQGFAYFGAGAAAGWLAEYPQFGGWAAGGAIVAGTDAAITEYNLTGKVTAKNVLVNSTFGAVTGQVGGYVFSKAAPFLTRYGSKLIPKIKFPFIQVGGRTTWFADDALTNQVANSLEKAFPGFVEDVEQLVVRNGETLTDFDIVTKNLIIEVASGGVKEKQLSY